MTTTLSETEGTPEQWPEPPEGWDRRAIYVASNLDGRADPRNIVRPDPAMIWQRIEAWTAWRWSPRPVAWIVEGPGEWRPRLAPVVVETVEVWRDDWHVAEAKPAPLGGLRLDAAGPYRITGTAGTEATPLPAVLEAFRRLAGYCSGGPEDIAGASSYGRNIAWSQTKDGMPDIQQSYTRQPYWAARELVNSGAADLLRPYRRAP